MKDYPTFGGDNLDQRSFISMMEDFFYQVRGKMVPGALVGSWIDWRQLPALVDAFQRSGLIWRGIFAWDKSAACRPNLGRFRAQCEFVVWGTIGPRLNEGPAGVGFYREPEYYEEHMPSSVSHYLKPSQKIHMTEKSVPVLMEILKVTRPGGWVLDCFAGSGSTGEACMNLGLNCVLVEENPEYIERIVTRLQKHQALIEAA